MSCTYVYVRTVHPLLKMCLDVSLDWCWEAVCISLYQITVLQEKDLYQEAEPAVAMGMAAALQVASRKGFIETKTVDEKPIKKASSGVVVKEEQARGG